MIDALVAGKNHGKPAKRTEPSGKPFVVAKVRTPTGRGEMIFINVIAFDEALGDALVALSGDEVSMLSGTSAASATANLAESLTQERLNAFCALQNTKSLPILTRSKQCVS